MCKQSYMGVLAAAYDCQLVAHLQSSKQQAAGGGIDMKGQRVRACRSGT